MNITRTTLLADAGCTCRGEVHDECRPCDECDQTPALNEARDEPGGDIVGWLCDECHEARVEEEDEREYQSILDDMEVPAGDALRSAGSMFR